MSRLFSCLIRYSVSVFLFGSLFVFWKVSIGETRMLMRSVFYFLISVSIIFSIKRARFFTLSSY